MLLVSCSQCVESGYTTQDGTNLVGLRGYPACDGVLLWDDIYSVLWKFLTVDFNECKDVVELRHGGPDTTWLA